MRQILHSISPPKVPNYLTTDTAYNFAKHLNGHLTASNVQSSHDLSEYRHSEYRRPARDNGPGQRRRWMPSPFWGFESEDHADRVDDGVHVIEGRALVEPLQTRGRVAGEGLVFLDSFLELGL